MSTFKTQPIEPQSTSLLLRYGEDGLPAKGPWNDVIGRLLAHRSVRGYTSDPLPDGTLETLIAAAQSAATSSNLQTWSVVAVSNPQVRAEFAKIANGQKHIEQCPLFLCFLADVSRNERLGREENVTLETIPHLETFVVAAIDAALAAQNAVVAAEALGLSTVYIGAMRNNVERVAELLQLPKGVMCVFGLCVGYPAEGAVSAVKARLPQSVVLHREVYRTDGEQRLRKTYDAELARYSKKHEMAQYTWTDRVINRMGKLGAMSGRDKIKAAIERLGFPLK